MKVINLTLTDLEGKPMRLSQHPESEIMTVAKILQAAAMHPTPDALPAKETIDRYEFAIAMHKVHADEEFELDLDLYGKLKPQIVKAFSTFAAGQAMKLIEG